MLISKNKAGFTIIELVIAIAILSSGIIGVYGAFYSITKLTSSASLRLTASYLAQEGLEIARNIRDDNFINNASWSAGLENCSQGCQADYKTGTTAQISANQLQDYDDNNFLKLNADGFYGYDSGVSTPFKRKITITQVSADMLKVGMSVMWNYDGQPFSVETEEYLYNWK